MDKKHIVQELKLRIDDRRVSCDEPMSKHSSFKIGGPADFFVNAGSIDEIKHAYTIFSRHQLPITLLGNGSNILVSDLGIRGGVIKVSENFKQVSVEGTVIKAQAGALLSTVANMAIASSLAGFEFASGIPGTLGGAVFMNAGAYGGEMKDVVKAVTVLNHNFEVVRLEKDQLTFGYRSSSVQDAGYTVLEVELDLHTDDQKAIQARVDDLTVKRTTKQPLHLPSAGSTFKRPEGYYAGKLIQDSGLRGIRYGDAAVSDLHCGFVVNLGQATFHDVTTLIKMIQKTVRDEFGVDLHPEVRMIGEGV